MRFLLSRPPIHRWLCAAAFLSCVDGCAGGSDSPAESQGIGVDTVTARNQPLTRTLRFTGTLYAEEEIVIGAKVAGRVKEVLHDLGDAVSVGQALLRIDDTDYMLARATRLEAANEALARLGLTKIPEKELNLNSLPSVESARLNAENSRSRYDRAKKLFERTPPLMSEQEFSNMRTEYEVSKNNHHLSILSAKSLLAQAASLYSQYLQADQLAKDTVHEVPSGKRPPLTRNSLSEPMTGLYYIASREVSVGDYVSIAAPLFRIVDQDNMKLRVQIPERYTARIEVGQEVDLRTDAYESTFQGRISRVSPTVNIESRTLAVEVAVPNENQKLRAGMFARADILVGAESVVMVPQRSLRNFAGVNKVLLIKDGKAVEKPVQLGQKDGDRFEIVEGVVAGDTIVVDPPSTLATGMPVIATVREQ